MVLCTFLFLVVSQGRDTKKFLLALSKKSGANVPQDLGYSNNNHIHQHDPSVPATQDLSSKVSQNVIKLDTLEYLLSRTLSPLMILLLHLTLVALYLRLI